MPYVSARYGAPTPLSPPDAPRNIVATDDQGQEWFLTEDSQVGDWLRFQDEGKAIEPYVPDSEAKPAPVPGQPAPTPTGVPRAQPDMVYGLPVEEGLTEKKPTAKKPAARKPAKRKSAKGK